MVAIYQMELALSREMDFLLILSLFVASALATDNKNYDGQPMDYFDDDFQSNLKVGPDSTFSFNFEQTRRDQSPQTEMREENVGRYIRTWPQTTTPASTFSMKNEKESQQHPTMMLADNYQHQQGHSNEPQVTSIPPPPKFAFSRPHSNRPNPEKYSAPTFSSVHQNDHPGKLLNDIHSRVPSVSTTTLHPVHHSEPPKTQSTPSPYYASSHPQGVEGIRFAPSASYVSDSITSNVPRQPPSLANRGKHKFSWNDIKKAEEITPPQTSSTPQSIPNKPPPPVPTLSPWNDNFGK